MKLLLLLALIRLCLAMPWRAEEALNSEAQLQKRKLAWDYQNDKIRGVNLGGWFVLEGFITPSLFDGWSQNGDDSQVPVDEYHYCQKLGKTVCKERLETHWKTWITEDDFKQILKVGLNMVRIPIGYWAFELLDSDPYIQGQQEYLEKALKWCRKYNLKAWVDLHGAPGSQNGFDNSGLRDSYKFQDGNHVQVTLSVLKQITEKYGGDEYADVVIGIELLNEPLGPILDMNKLKQFYTSGYSQLREIAGPAQACIIHDAFMTLGYWNDILTVKDGAWSTVVDHHHYQVFSARELSRSVDEHIDVVCKQGVNATEEYHWNVVGEWTAAMTDCARWLNGIGHGARYSGDYDDAPYIGSCTPFLDYGTWPDEYRTGVRKYIEAQMDAYEKGAGWIFWTWKTENAIEWDFSRLLAAGFVPLPLSDREYPNQC